MFTVNYCKSVLSDRTNLVVYLLDHKSGHNFPTKHQTTMVLFVAGWKADDEFYSLEFCRLTKTTILTNQLLQKQG